MTGIIENGTIGPAVLVFGAAGDVGRGVVRAALEAGRRVVAVDGDADALEALRARHPQSALATLAASISSDGDAAGLASRLRALGIAFDGVVANIAGAHPCGRLIDQPADVLRRTLDEDLMPHLFAARHLLPLLPREAPAGGYVLVGGPGGHYPWAGYGHCSIAAAALRMMARVLHDEAARSGLRVQLLSLDAPVGADDTAAQANDAWPKAVTIGRRALALLEGARGSVAAPIVEFAAQSMTSRVIERMHASPPPSRSGPVAHAPSARELRDARSLLSSLSVLPPTSPGILHDETF